MYTPTLYSHIIFINFKSLIMCVKMHYNSLLGRRFSGPSAVVTPRGLDGGVLLGGVHFTLLALQGTFSCCKF